MAREYIGQKVSFSGSRRPQHRPQYQPQPQPQHQPQPQPQPQHSQQQQQAKTAKPAPAAKPDPAAQMQLFQNVVERCLDIVLKVEKERVEIYGREHVTGQRLRQEELIIGGLKAAGGLGLEFLSGILPAAVAATNAVLAAAAEAEMARTRAEGERDVRELKR